MFSVSKNICYQKLRSKETIQENFEIVEEGMENYQENDFPDESELSESLRLGLLQKYFRKLDRICQKILQLFYKGSSHSEISSKLNISNDVSRKRKKECLDKLTGMITSDPEYRNFYGS